MTSFHQFIGNPTLTKLMTEVYGLAAWTNPLHPDTFPGVRKMEAEVIDELIS